MDLREKLVIDAHQCTAPGVHRVMVRRGCSSFKRRDACTYTRGSVRRASGFVLTSNPEVRADLRSDGPPVHAWDWWRSTGSLASSRAEIGADAWANIGAGHRMVTKLGPLCKVKLLKNGWDKL